jgi:hypothetical protein
VSARKIGRICRVAKQTREGDVSTQEYLREQAAADYLRKRFGFGAKRTLSKLRCIGGGPAFRKVGRLVIYAPDELDAWARSRMSAPMRSTSDAAV